VRKLREKKAPERSTGHIGLSLEQQGLKGTSEQALKTSRMKRSLRRMKTLLERGARV